MELPGSFEAVSAAPGPGPGPLRARLVPRAGARFGRLPRGLLRHRRHLLRGGALLLLAATVALAATWVAATWLEAAASRRPAVAAAVPTVPVLVAATDLVPGGAIAPSQLRVAPFPEAHVNDAFLRPADPRLAAGASALVAIPSGTPLLAGFLADARGLLAARLEPGMRALAIPVSASSSVAGLIAPGDRVDLLFTRTLPTGRSLATTLAADVKVLGLDQRTAPAAGGDGAGVPATVTLEVTPRQAEEIALVEPQGRITLVLRGEGGDGPSPAPGPRLASDMLGVSAELLAASVAEATAPPPAPSAAPVQSAAPAPSAALGRASAAVEVVRGSSLRGTASPAADPGPLP